MAASTQFALLLAEENVVNAFSPASACRGKDGVCAFATADICARADSMSECVSQ